jgi:hypothetical protein
MPFTLLGIAYLVTYVRMDPEALAFADIWGCFVVSTIYPRLARVYNAALPSVTFTTSNYSTGCHGFCVVEENCDAIWLWLLEYASHLLGQ